MRARLDAGPDDGEDARVLTCQQARGQGSRARRARGVMEVPSMSATGVPSAGSKSAIAAWCEGRPALCGKTETSLQPSPAEGR